MERITAMEVKTPGGWKISGGESNATGTITLTISPPQGGPSPVTVDVIVHYLGGMLENPSLVAIAAPTDAVHELSPDDLKLREKFDQPVNELEISGRGATCARNNNVEFVGQLVQFVPRNNGLRAPQANGNIKNLGRHTRAELEGILKERGLTFGMNYEVTRLGWTPEGAKKRNSVRASKHAARAASESR